VRSQKPEVRASLTSQKMSRPECGSRARDACACSPKSKEDIPERTEASDSGHRGLISSMRRSTAAATVPRAAGLHCNSAGARVE
jgi:hypothetical protein